MDELNWEMVAEELARHEGMLRVASLLKRAYANTVAGVIAEFDRVATDEAKATKFVKDMATSWWAVKGPNGEYFAVEMDDWDQVAEHIHSTYPKIVVPSFFDSEAHRAGLVGQDQNKRKFDKRP